MLVKLDFDLAEGIAACVLMSFPQECRRWWVGRGQTPLCFPHIFSVNGQPPVLEIASHFRKGFEMVFTIKM